jgi:hypothetical protein
VTDDWFGVRSWFLFDAGALLEDHGQMYEERITLWRAGSATEAQRLAAVEADAYAAETGSTRLDCVETFRMFDAPGQSVEVWSVHRESWLPPDEFLARFVTEGVRPGTDE